MLLPAMKFVRNKLKILVKIFNINSNNTTITGIDAASLAKQKNEEYRRTLLPILHGALGALHYNGPHVGNAQVPFEIEPIRQLRKYASQIGLSNEEIEQLDTYIRRAGICNGGRTTRDAVPGIVQNQRYELIPMVENYIKKLEIQATL